jgi:16S rRNA (uracil1498-N3)-methyltransferase
MKQHAHLGEHLQRIVVDHNQINDGIVHLNASQQHYVHRVLRLKLGDRILIMDGRGQTWLATLNSQGAELLETIGIQTELPVAIHLWVAPPKGNGLEEIIRQATEVGVAHLHPILSNRTLLQPSPNKLERWRRIALESAEQAERQVILTIAEPVPFQDALFWQPQSPPRYLSVTRREVPHLLNCLKHQSAQSEIWLATGPEGGWTEAEVNRAIAAGVECVSLGARILRAVTAPIVAANLVAAWYESMGESNGQEEC